MKCAELVQVGHRESQEECMYTRSRSAIEMLLRGQAQSSIGINGRAHSVGELNRLEWPR